MGFMTAMKAGRAYRLQKKGETEEAIRVYEEAYADGLNDPRFNLAYAMLIIRKGEYQKAKEFLVKHQKTPGMTPDQRVNLLVYYAACCFRLGDLDKGISTLEQQFRKTETGLLFQTLGYLYVEKFDLSRKQAFLEKAAAEIKAREAAEAAAAAEAQEGAATQGDTLPAAQDANPDEAEAAPAAPRTPEEAWEQGVEKAEAFIRRGVEYDDEDPVCLDNMGQFLYRVKGDREGAKPWFDKALEQKEGQIDTLYFLSRYDEEAGRKDAAAARLEKALEGRFSPLNYCSREMAEAELARLKGEK